MLYGLFIVVKDFVNVVGFVMMMGLLLFVLVKVVKIDDIMVVCMCDVGVIVIGKINMLEFGFGSYIINLVFGFMCNLWDFMCIVGGFLGGVVVVLVMGMLVLVDGLDMMGFLCNFVGWIGIYGLCFSFGVVLLEFYVDSFLL